MGKIVKPVALMLVVVSLLMIRCASYSKEWSPSWTEEVKYEKDAQRAQVSQIPPIGSFTSEINFNANESAPKSKRQVIYSSCLRLVVFHLRESLQKVQDIAGKFNGYMQEMTGNSILIRVPPDSFYDAIAEIEKIGEVVTKDIKGQDVTEEMHDLGVRIKNAEDVRNRLAGLLEKCGMMEDALKIEKELERVTGEIETLKGKLQFISHNVDHSAIRVEFNIKNPTVIQQISLPLPFPWLNELGLDHILNYSPETRGKGSSSKFKMENPEGFVRMEYPGWQHGIRLISADGINICVSVKPNLKGGALDFWRKLILRALVEGKAYSPISEEKLKTKKGAEGVILQFGTEQASGKAYRYDIAIFAKESSFLLFIKTRKLYLVEISGPEEVVKKEYDKIKNALANSKF
ncbi:MAG: DUF4349 domain-containing protein [Planctomycetes bacterium]|nr:DUF4349 domain-containing protein [Planctomycetota bacterium]